MPLADLGGRAIGRAPSDECSGCMRGAHEKPRALLHQQARSTLAAELLCGLLQRSRSSARRYLGDLGRTPERPRLPRERERAPRARLLRYSRGRGKRSEPWLNAKGRRDAKSLRGAVSTRARLPCGKLYDEETSYLGRAGRAPLPLDNRWARPPRRQQTSSSTTGATRSTDRWSAPMAHYSREYPRFDPRARYKSAPT